MYSRSKIYITSGTNSIYIKYIKLSMHIKCCRNISLTFQLLGVGSLSVYELLLLVNE